MSRRQRREPGDLPGVALRVEEILLAAGSDAFAETLKLIAALAHGGEDGLEAGLERARARHPGQSALSPFLAPAAALEACRALLLPHVQAAGDLAVADAAFEAMTSRSAKGDKGQFFTPRHVVELAVRLVAPRDHEIVLDPAAGSGAFLWHAARAAKVRARGIEVDPRAASVARLLLALSGCDDVEVRLADALRSPIEKASVVLTNPPFAGEVADPELLASFELGRGKKRVERDILFLERAVLSLVPGGRLGIVLPQRTLSEASLAHVREWLLLRCRVVAVIGLDPSTFMPHTQQRTALLVGERRRRVARVVPPGEEILFAVSDASGVSARGVPVLREGATGGSAWHTLDHDLGAIEDRARAFWSAP